MPKIINIIAVKMISIAHKSQILRYFLEIRKYIIISTTNIIPIINKINLAKIILPCEF